MQIAYLACPYSDPDPRIREMRYNLVTRAAFDLMRKGIFVFSPITHNIPVDKLGIHGNWMTWKNYDHEMLSRCDRVIVLKLPGWENSKGVAAEIAVAKHLGKPIEWMELSEEIVQTFSLNAKKKPQTGMNANKRSINIKNYICNTFIKEDPEFLSAKQHAKEEGLPNISIPENVGKLLCFLAKIHRPKRILEVGTLAGYSTLWLAKGAPNAMITTLEWDPKHAATARRNFINAGVDSRINVVEGDAMLTLEQLDQNVAEPFDLIFLDANKEGYPFYLPLLMRLSRPGTLLLTDNPSTSISRSVESPLKWR